MHRFSFSLKCLRTRLGAQGSGAQGAHKVINRSNLFSSKVGAQGGQGPRAQGGQGFGAQGVHKVRTRCAQGVIQHAIK